MSDIPYRVVRPGEMERAHRVARLRYLEKRRRLARRAAAAHLDRYVNGYPRLFGKIGPRIGTDISVVLLGLMRAVETARQAREKVRAALEEHLRLEATNAAEPHDPPHAGR